MNNKKHGFKTPILFVVVIAGTLLSALAAADTGRGSFRTNPQAIAAAPESFSLPTSIGAQDSVQALIRDLNQRDQARIIGIRGETTLEARRARHHHHLRWIRELRKGKGKRPNV